MTIDAKDGHKNEKAWRVATAADLLAAVRRAARQEQFLEVVSADEARRRFAEHVARRRLPASG